MNPATDLTIVTTATGPYVHFLREWAASIRSLASPPAFIVIAGNGLSRAHRQAAVAALEIARLGRFVDLPATTCGAARNLAVSEAETRWVMHLDADDVLLPTAMKEIAAVGDAADVVSLGYEHWWPHNPHGFPRKLAYPSLDGLAALKAARICSGCSPFRVEMWQHWRYPEHLQASWDYGLWLGFAHLGARFRPTRLPAFRYRQWGGSHWKRVGQRVHNDLLLLRRELEADFVAAQARNLGTIVAATPA